MLKEFIMKYYIEKKNNLFISNPKEILCDNILIHEYHYKGEANMSAFDNPLFLECPKSAKQIADEYNGIVKKILS